MKRGIVTLFIFATIFRLISLNQSLWLDEATTARVVENFSYLDIVNKFSPSDFHPPAYYLVMKIWTSIFGYSEIALRTPSIIFSLLTGWMLYLMGGIWAAAFYLFNPLIVYYSQESRMYMMVTFLLTSLLYFLKKKNLLVCNLLIGLSFLTFYGSIFFIGALYLYLLWKKDFKLLFKLLPGFILSFIIISPLLYQQFINSRIVTESVSNWKQVLGPASIKNLVLIPIKFAFGRISFEPKKLYYALSGLWTLFVFGLIFKNLVKNKNRKFLTFLFITPIFFGLIFSFFTPLLQYFRFIYLIPLLALLFNSSKLNKSLKFIVISGFTILSLIYLLTPSFHREDWKSLVKFLPDNKVYMIPSSSDPVTYYNPNIEVKDIRSINKKQKEIVVIPYTAEIHGIDYMNILKKAGFKNLKQFTFLEVFYIRATL